MADYNRALSDAKQCVTSSIARMAAEKADTTIMDVAGDVDRLNKAWDELTNALVRQRAVMHETIEHLHAKLAEERRRR